MDSAIKGDLIYPNGRLALCSLHTFEWRILPRKKNLQFFLHLFLHITFSYALFYYSLSSKHFDLEGTVSQDNISIFSVKVPLITLVSR
jgi:hypothetical protein